MIQNRQQLCPQCRRYRWIPLALAPHCTKSCRRAALAAGPMVRCCVCDQEWSARDSGVLYRSEDGRWWCRDEIGCRKRKGELLMRMQVALNTAWRALDELAARS